GSHRQLCLNRPGRPSIPTDFRSRRWHRARWAPTRSGTPSLRALSKSVESSVRLFVPAVDRATRREDATLEPGARDTTGTGRREPPSARNASEGATAVNHGRSGQRVRNGLAAAPGAGGRKTGARIVAGTGDWRDGAFRGRLHHHVRGVALPAGFGRSPGPRTA